MIAVIKISLVCALLAQLITRENGPLFIFSNMRVKMSVWLQTRSVEIGAEINYYVSDKRKTFLVRKLQVFKSLGDLVVCPYCLVIWLQLLGVAIFANDHLLENWLVGSALTYIWLGLFNGRS